MNDFLPDGSRVVVDHFYRGTFEGVLSHSIGEGFYITPDNIILPGRVAVVLGAMNFFCVTLCHSVKLLKLLK